MPSPVVRAEGISKQYRIGTRADALIRRETITEAFLGRGRRRQEYFWALKDINFDVGEGEVFGIIGRNGSGKSTLLRILSRITPPTAGRAELQGRVGSLLEVGTGFHPELTGRENVFLNGAILGMSRRDIRRRFEEIVAFAGVERFLETPVKHYSSGMYVRLGFAVAAHLELEILIVDEVLAVGDIAFQRKCLGKMEGAAREGRTVLFVSHNMAAVKSLCQRATLLELGRQVAEGHPDDIVQEYVALAVEKEAVEEDALVGTDGWKAVGIRLRRVEVGGGCQAQRATVFWNQSIDLTLEIEVCERIDNAVFGVGVQTVEGVPVLTVHHNDLGAPLWSFEAGTYRIELSLENPLRAGWYSLAIGAHEALARTPLFHVQQAAQFQVLDVSDDEHHYIEHNAGLINGRSTWRAPERVR